MSRTISPGQRRALFALAGERGLDIDALRDMTPTGSISALSYAQAGDLVARLKGRVDTGRPRARGRRGSGGLRPVSPQQRSYIRHLAFDKLGLTHEQLDRLVATHHNLGGAAAGLADVLTGQHAGEIIEGLKAQLDRRPVDVNDALTE